MKLRNSIGSKLLLMMLAGMLIPAIVLFVSLLFSVNHISSSSQTVIADQVLSEVKNGIKNTVDSVISSVEAKYKDKVNGLTDEQISQIIKSEFDSIRYGESGYFFGYFYDGIRLIAPENKSMEGKNLWDLSDKDGVKVVQEIIKASKNNGGFFEYMWLNPKTEKEEKKLSYTAPVKVGNVEIAVGTGTYLPMIEQSKLIISQNIEKTKDSIVAPVTIICIVVLFVLLAFLYLFLMKRIVRPISDLTEIAELISHDNLSKDVKVIESNDEIGNLSKSFIKMHSNLKNMALAVTEIAEGNIIENNRLSGFSSTEGDLSKAIFKQANSIKHVISDIDSLVQGAIDGRLNVRIDTSNHNGDFKKIAVGINNTLNAAIEPIKEASVVLMEMSKGNLDVEIKGDYKGDHAEIKNALNNTIKSLKNYIHDITTVLNEMSNGNLDMEISSDYEGSFIKIKESINKIIKSMNTLLLSINNASEQVLVGSRQVANSSQLLAQGSTEQASAIEEVTSAINEIAEQTKKNALSAGMANDKSLMVKEYASQGNIRMIEMLKAMEDINQSSNSISKIVKVIEEIAFQTNILSLNAAVEAARAGVYGKGFAVVAEEVRNLAARSSNAAKETTDMIESSINKIKNGSNIAIETAGALDKIVESVSDAVNLVGNIATSSNEQATSISQINQSIIQVSQVIQTNSATAQEQAASSEELSSQAESMRDMISKLKLKEQSALSGDLELDEDLLHALENRLQNINNTKAPKRNSKRSNNSTSSGRPSIDLNDFGKY
ncbi:methyl-accepting chemotaxis protein [Pseudobacteroides cellulosolvens]|uniref:Methyl-accepting chemotaxis sensory transducer with Cache sensor n=1 Tax=Pseudobacteroides cellulosolvens ATCC 35603 = DSM 2933 TaxID=398512 RepID=A0A0L6JL76_9FIRM|nr:methyl-accepting chemotaxis protein [Pseudobacteroides cellulosolvens]KNY26493.1 methyl-accepting chemotaxis sensory transducer with Cache sensor [Pseudobacteroides cellulosolvens ATCC 35603 = DSM 2933]